MDLNWALGVSDISPSSIEIITHNGEQTVVDIESAIKTGIPNAQGSKRLLYEGEFSSWKASSASAYLAGLDMTLPDVNANRHEVLTMSSDKGLTVHVPALVLMRAFFKPNHLLFRAVFAPAGIDLLSFVDYSTTPPEVVIDDLACTRHLSSAIYGVIQNRALQWLQLSKSAKKAGQSVYQNALNGWLKMSLPLGRVRVVFHGPSDGKHLYATKATLISIEVLGNDSITGAREEINFHAMADSDRNPTASIRELTVPVHPDGRSAVTETEWTHIEPILRGQKYKLGLHSRRELLDIILYKLASGISWKAVPRGSLAITDLTSTFRRWTTTGRMDKVLVFLERSRNTSTFTASLEA